MTGPDARGRGLCGHAFQDEGLAPSHSWDLGWALRPGRMGLPMLLAHLRMHGSKPRPQVARQTGGRSRE